MSKELKELYYSLFVLTFSIMMIVYLGLIPGLLATLGVHHTIKTGGA